MPSYQIKPAQLIRGKIFLPGDKSIAHRSIIISSIAKGKTYIYNFPVNQDCLITLKAFKRLGVGISQISSTVSSFNLCVEGRGLYKLKKTHLPLFAGESGTTFRLLLGVLSGQCFNTTLTAGRGLLHRPMRRVTEPLRRMGAIIRAQSAKHKTQSATEEYPPVTIKGGNLHGISYKMPVASAQVKSALLLAGLYARGATKIFEPIKTRDHTERMLRDFGADIKMRKSVICIHGQKELTSPQRIDIPGDISSASFFIVAAILLPHSHLVIKSVGLNPTRMGIIRVLKRMGANIKIIPTKSPATGSELVGDMVIKSSSLRGTTIKSNEVPQLIDELPVMMLVSCLSKGKTIIYGAQELKVKETDRIISMSTNLLRMGANIYVQIYDSRVNRDKYKIVINGVENLKGARISSFGDHRTAMSMAVAGLLCQGNSVIDDVGCIAKSFPNFLNLLKSVVK
jgi:3-phosphoshikimate 1-carboxyvinyltransferase